MTAEIPPVFQKAWDQQTTECERIKVDLRKTATDLVHTEKVTQEFLDAVNAKTTECEVLKKDLIIAERGADAMTKKYLDEFAKSTKLGERLMEVENALDAMTDKFLTSSSKEEERLRKLKGKNEKIY